MICNVRCSLFKVRQLICCLEYKGRVEINRLSWKITPANICWMFYAHTVLKTSSKTFFLQFVLLTHYFLLPLIAVVTVWLRGILFWVRIIAACKVVCFFFLGNVNPPFKVAWEYPPIYLDTVLADPAAIFCSDGPQWPLPTYISRLSVFVMLEAELEWKMNLESILAIIYFQIRQLRSY